MDPAAEHKTEKQRMADETRDILNTFDKYDKDKDGLLNEQEVREYAWRQYEVPLSQETLRDFYSFWVGGVPRDPDEFVYLTTQIMGLAFEHKQQNQLKKDSQNKHGTSILALHSAAKNVFALRPSNSIEESLLPEPLLPLLEVLDEVANTAYSCLSFGDAIVKVRDELDRQQEAVRTCTTPQELEGLIESRDEVRVQLKEELASALAAFDANLVHSARQRNQIDGGHVDQNCDHMASCWQVG
eukprot:12431506-Karenia_brevis.AAC.2